MIKQKLYIHNLKDQEGKADRLGSNPFEKIYTERNGRKVCLSGIYPTYDWVDDEGYNNFANWVENATQKAGKQYMMWKTKMYINIKLRQRIIQK